MVQCLYVTMGITEHVSSGPVCVAWEIYLLIRFYMLCTNVEHIEHEMYVYANRFDDDTRSLRLALMPSYIQSWGYMYTIE